MEASKAKKLASDSTKKKKAKEKSEKKHKEKEHAREGRKLLRKLPSLVQEELNEVIFPVIRREAKKGKKYLRWYSFSPLDPRLNQAVRKKLEKMGYRLEDGSHQATSTNLDTGHESDHTAYYTEIYWD